MQSYTRGSMYNKDSKSIIDEVLCVQGWSRDLLSVYRVTMDMACTLITVVYMYMYMYVYLLFTKVYIYPSGKV